MINSICFINIKSSLASRSQITFYGGVYEIRGNKYLNVTVYIQQTKKFIPTTDA